MDLFRKYSLVVVLIVAGFIVFSPTFNAQWVFDDFPVVVHNPDVKSIEGFLADSYPGRPIRELTYLLDNKFFGENPTGYHIQNIGWHVFAAILISFLMKSLGRPKEEAVVASLLFLLHPLVTEVVANVSHRKDSLLLVFCLLSALFFLKAIRGGRLFWVPTVICGVLAYLSKQPAVVLPVVFLCLYLLFSEKTRRNLRKIFGLSVAALIALLIPWMLFLSQNEKFQAYTQSTMTYFDMAGPPSLSNYYLIIAKATMFMWGRILFPVNLGVEYHFNPPTGFFDFWVLSTLVSIFLIFALIFRYLDKLPIVSFGLFWFLLFQIPTSNFLWPLSYFAADRYMYVPLAGLFMAVSPLTLRVFKGNKTFIWPIFVPILIAVGVLSWEQSKIWKSEFSLYQNAVEVSPESSSALVGLAMAHYNQGEYEQALDLSAKAAKLNSNQTDAIYVMALANEGLGKIGKAKILFQIFIQGDGGIHRKYLNAARMRLLYYQRGGKH